MKRNNLQQILEFLDNHKFCRRSLFLSLEFCMIIWALSLNYDNLIIIIKYLFE